MFLSYSIRIDQGYIVEFQSLDDQFLGGVERFFLHSVEQEEKHCPHIAI